MARASASAFWWAAQGEEDSIRMGEVGAREASFLGFGIGANQYVEGEQQGWINLPQNLTPIVWI